MLAELAEYSVMIAGRPVMVAGIDLADGVAATLTVDDHQARVNLDLASERTAFATTTGLDPADLEALRDRVRAAAINGRPSGQPAIALPAVDPFPLDVLPPVVRSYCESAARSLGDDVPVEMVAGPMLAMVGALVGKRLGIAPKGSWTEYPGLFIAVVARPGSAKTAAVGLARKPIARLQIDAKARFDEELAAFKQDHAAWVRDKDNEDRGPEPERPRMGHYFTSDATIERLGEMLGQNAGISVIVDELRGWLLSFDKYRQGKGSDRQQYLSVWGSETIKIDRKTGDPLFVSHPVASLIGGLQTDFAADFQLPQGSDGMAERILPIVLNHGSQSWTEESVTARQSDDLFALFQQLDSLDPQRYDEDSITVHLHPDAYRLWVAFYNANAKRVNASSGLGAGMYQKLSNHTIRLALILHALWHADDPRVMVSEQTMSFAIELSDWWRGHIERYLYLVGCAEATAHDDRLSQRILRILRNPQPEDDRKGWITRTNIYNRLRTVRSDELDGALAYLEAAGRIEQRLDRSATKRGTSWRIAQHVDSEDSYFSENLARNGRAEPNTPNNQNPQNGVHSSASDDSTRVVWQAPPAAIPADPWGPGDLPEADPWDEADTDWPVDAGATKPMDDP